MNDKPNDLRRLEGQRWVRCHNWDVAPWKQCVNRAMPGGAIYCEKHYPLYYSDTGLDSGPGLDHMNIVHMSSYQSIKKKDNGLIDEIMKREG